MRLDSISISGHCCMMISITRSAELSGRIDRAF